MLKMGLYSAIQYSLAYWLPIMHVTVWGAAFYMHNFQIFFGSAGIRRVVVSERGR